MTTLGPLNQSYSGTFIYVDNVQFRFLQNSSMTLKKELECLVINE